MKFIQKHKFEKVVIKPELGAFKEGFTIIENPTSQKLQKLFTKLKKKQYMNSRIRLHNCYASYNTITREKIKMKTLLLPKKQMFILMIWKIN